MAQSHPHPWAWPPAAVAGSTESNTFKNIYDKDKVLAGDYCK